jgi:hypothetical protein
VEPQEIDIALDELETRLDRLRSLYEQYFLGIEKIEPTVARKDVDRRFWIMRRTQIRNTARRFRMQVLIQRYNTFQQYWTRICREIDNGTYARHLLRVEKTFGSEAVTWKAKKRRGLLGKDQAEPKGADAAATKARGEGPSDLATLLDSGVDLAREAERAASEAVASAERGATAARVAKPAPSPRVLEDLGPLDLDFDDAPSAPAARPASAAAPAARAERSAVPLPEQSAAAPDVGPPAGPPPMARPVSAPASPAARADGERPRVPGARPQSAPDSGGRLAQPAAGSAAAPTPAAGAARGPTAGPPAGVAASRPAAPPGGGPSAGSPAAARPPAPGALSEDRVRQIHAELVAAKRQLNQGENVSMDSLAKSLRDTEAKLRSQHQGRSIDFQIVVKDGKPVVKPVVRK